MGKLNGDYRTCAICGEDYTYHEVVHNQEHGEYIDDQWICLHCWRPAVKHFPFLIIVKYNEKLLLVETYPDAHVTDVWVRPATKDTKNPAIGITLAGEWEVMGILEDDPANLGV